MNARTATASLALLAALTLTGCSGASDSGQSDAQRLSEAATASPAPLAAEPTEDPATGTDAAYLEHLRASLEGSGGNSIPNATDEQLIAAGNDACEQLAAGVAFDEIRVIEDEPLTETGYKDSTRIAAVAAIHLCPEFDPGS